MLNVEPSRPKTSLAPQAILNAKAPSPIARVNATMGQDSWKPESAQPNKKQAAPLNGDKFVRNTTLVAGLSSIAGIGLFASGAAMTTLGAPLTMGLLGVGMASLSLLMATPVVLPLLALGKGLLAKN